MSARFILAERNDIGTAELELLTRFGSRGDGRKVGVWAHDALVPVGVGNVEQPAPEIELGGLLDEERRHLLTHTHNTLEIRASRATGADSASGVEREFLNQIKTVTTVNRVSAK